MFAQITERWGRLDFLLHSIAFAPMDDLLGPRGRLLEDRLPPGHGDLLLVLHPHGKLAEPLMERGSTLFCMSYYGSQMVVEHYNLMGPVKAALEAPRATWRPSSAARASASMQSHPGPLATRAASGIGHFDELLAKAQAKAPARSLVSIDDVGWPPPTSPPTPPG